MIAKEYGVKIVEVLTGFKFIGEQIGKLEQQGNEDSFLFGFEESYGYLTGTYVRDKDGVNGAYMICEMFSYYATRGISLLEKLEELYQTIKITPRDYTFNDAKDECDVTAEVSYTVDGEQRSDLCTFHCEVVDDNWYIFGMK